MTAANEGSAERQQQLYERALKNALLMERFQSSLDAHHRGDAPIPSADVLADDARRQRAGSDERPRRHGTA